MTVTAIAGRDQRIPTRLDGDPATVVVNVQIAVPRDAPDAKGVFALADRLHALAAAQAATARISTTIAVVVDETNPGTSASSPQPTVTAAELMLFTDRRIALIDGRQLCLTRLEYELLLYLADSRGRVATRGQLLRQVWGYTVISGVRTVDVHVRRVRAKLAGRGPDIITVRGVGYRLDRLHRVNVIRERGDANRDAPI
jgi:DNA-binding winged helix-turn-helix (wHTH) protein